MVGFLFAATGPKAMILAAGYGLPAFLTLGFSLSHRQPIAFAWSIAAAVVSARRSSGSGFAECIGAYLATGALIAVLGATGFGKRAVPLQFYHPTPRDRETGSRACRRE